MNLYNEPKTESKLQPHIKHHDFYCEECRRWYSLEEIDYCEDCGQLICARHHECPFMPKTADWS